MSDENIMYIIANKKIIFIQGFYFKTLQLANKTNLLSINYHHIIYNETAIKWLT